MNEPKIALVCNRPADNLPATWNQYASIAQLLNTEGATDILILDQPASDLHANLMQLRTDARYRLSPVYIRGTAGSEHPLADGPLPDSSADLDRAHAQITSRLATFNRGVPPATLDEYVLAWLWTRPQAELVPQRNGSLPHIYEYPLLTALGGQEKINQTLWLRLMEEQGLLSPGPLTDRIRLCNQCNSGHINYVDVCPSCSELDISKQPALHCFTCGHVAPQEHFLKDGLLLCPNCLSKLRHIGSDYDRPLENQTCNRCRNSFVDASVQARCLDCGHTQQPEELRIRQIHSYRLTEKARLRCRQGLSVMQSGDYFSRLGLVSHDSFIHLLEWQLQQSQRYKQAPACSVLGLRLDGLEHLLDTPAGQATLDSLVERIEQAIRDTDRCSHSREDLLWFLLPHTDRNGATVLARRMQGLADLLATHDKAVQIRVVACTLPHDLVQDETAPLLLARLTDGVQ